MSAVSLRLPSVQDEDAIVDFYRRIGAADAAVGTVTREEWRRFLNLPQNDSGRGFRIVESGDAIVALATSSLRKTGRETVRHFRILVEPAHRRRGIAFSLLFSLTQADPSDIPIVLQALCPEPWGAMRSFLERFGFVRVETEIEMVAEQPRVAELGPSDVRIERVAAPQSRAADVARLHNENYRDAISFVPHTAEQMSRLLAAGGDLWIAMSGNEVVGFCHLEPDAGAVWLESLVVDGRFRTRGVGSRLAATALADAGAGPGRPARLLVDDTNPRAVSLYRRLGFLPVATTHRYRADREAVLSGMKRTAAVR